MRDDNNEAIAEEAHARLDAAAYSELQLEECFGDETEQDGLSPEQVDDQDDHNDDDDDASSDVDRR